ncbi:contactin-5-like [Haliotis cracherodii]|uniref:contactin-5-like n=1 Tax=Haliotis cracherodii TaxID=6455 RepID=UPI0039EAE069
MPLIANTVGISHERVENILFKEQGNYSCKATAGQSSKAIAVSLLVYKVPAVTLSPSTLSLREGDQRNFTCQVNNAPAVKTVPRSLVWCESDQVVTDQSKIVRVRDGMEILMMNSSDRAGVYKCGVINCTKTATLVITKPEVIVEGQCNQTDGTYIHDKTTVAVHCDFRSNTFANLSISCSRKGTEMSKSDRISYETGRQRRNPGLFYAQFQFTPVLRRDRGNYSCKATSGQSSKAIAVTLLVYEVPTVTLSPSTLSLQEGDQRNFTCQVNNAPAVKTVPGSLVWCESDQVVTDQSKIVRVRDGMEILMMNSSDRAEVYKCGVINCTETATLVITKPEGTEMSKSDRISYETGLQRRNPGLFYAQFQFTPVLRRDRGKKQCDVELKSLYI